YLPDRVLDPSRVTGAAFQAVLEIREGGLKIGLAPVETLLLHDGIWRRVRFVVRVRRPAAFRGVGENGAELAVVTHCDTNVFQLFPGCRSAGRAIDFVEVAAQVLSVPTQAGV